MELSVTTGPMMNWANARNTICHHSRNAGNMPARAMIAPSKVAGTAAIAQVATPPYTSMRLACASNIIAAMSTRLAIRLPHGWRLRPMPRSTLLLVIQITECVESAQEPVVVEVPVYVPEEVPVYVPLDPAYAAVLVLVILDWSKVMRAPP